MIRWAELTRSPICLCSHKRAMRSSKAHASTTYTGAIGSDLQSRQVRELQVIKVAHAFSCSTVRTMTSNSSTFLCAQHLPTSCPCIGCIVPCSCLHRAAAIRAWQGAPAATRDVLQCNLAIDKMGSYERSRTGAPVRCRSGDAHVVASPTQAAGRPSWEARMPHRCAVVQQLCKRCKPL